MARGLVKINIEDQQQALFVDAVQVRAVVRHLLQQEQIQTDEISLYFVDVPTISQIHEDAFADPSPTDCMTFPLDAPGAEPEEGHHILGEAVICPAMAVDQSLEQGTDPYYELTLYIVHCFLHLIGYEDTSPALRQQMRAKEEDSMQALAQSKLWLQPVQPLTQELT